MRSRRFTVIELIVVMAIIAVLATLLVVGLGSSKVKAYNKASLALVNKVKAALTHYHSEFRDYPPDGYDIEPGWDVDPNGVLVGQPPRRVKGTSSLMYFLGQPLIKTWTIGADADDARNVQRKRVGPFLATLEGNESSRTGFKPAHPWEDASYWDGQQYRLTMIVDAFSRPLCYDKVKTADPVFFQADRFQNPSGSSGKGIAAHPDINYMNTEVLAGIEPEAESNACADMTPENLIGLRPDPRLTDTAFQSMITGLDGTGPFSLSAGTAPPAGTHKPKNVGGYDLWSSGEKWADPRDDLTSWGD